MDYLKNPQYFTIPSAIQKKVVDAVRLQGKALACHVTGISGAIITVQFDLNDIYTLPQVNIPLFGPEYIRYPIKVGDLGIVQPVDVSISYTSGQGGNPPNLSDPASLEALYFMPIGNKNWVTVDPTQVTIYAPNGVLVRDTTSAAQINLHPGDIKITLGSSTWEMTPNSVTVTTETYTVNAPTIILNGNLTQGTSGSGYPATLQGPITVIHEVTANGIPVSSHLHGGVTAGGSDTGVPIA
jgi:hypothetical protein